jgi:hypothetical protein
MYLTDKLIRALNMRLLGGTEEFKQEARYARRIIAKWRHRHPKKRLSVHVVHDALIDTWNDLHGFKEWRKVEVELAMAAERVVMGSRRKRPRKSMERPRGGWF